MNCMCLNLVYIEMMKELCKYITEPLNLDHETYEVMYYGLFVCVTNLMSILSVIIIGTLLRELENTIFFLIGFIPLRLYIGGYHASTPLRCYWYFNIVAAVFIILFKWNVNVNVMFLITVTLLSIVLIQIIKDKENSKKSIIIMILIYLGIMILLYSCDKYSIFLWSIILNILLYEVKIIQNKYKNDRLGGVD